jgi:2-methylcitrate dehydratase PrpD
MTSLEQLGRFVARHDAKTLPDALRQKLRLHVADVVGAWVAATATAEGKALIAYRARNGRGLSDDVMTACALARLSEIDDIHVASMTTPGAIVIPAALTIAASLPAVASADLEAAIVAGYETMIRLGLAIDGPTVLYRGIWPTYIGAPVGVAAAAARLYGLDETQTAHALASALTLAAPGVGHHNATTTSRWFAIGNAARNGLIAALGAQSGFTADLSLLDGPFFQNVFGVTPSLPALVDGLDQPLSVAQLSFKPWCAARQTMAAVQALREIMAAGAGPGDITDIRVAVLPPHLKMIDHGVIAGDRASFLTSLPYQMAAAALTPAALDDLSQTKANVETLRPFMQRIRLSADDALLAGYPAVWTARVTVTTPAGERDNTVSHVPGDPARPFDQPTVTGKFVRFAAPILGETEARTLLAQALGVLDKPPLAAEIVQRIARAT